MAPLTDTSSDIAELQRARLASMTPRERGRLLASLCDAVNEASLAGIRLQFPDAYDREVRSLLLLRRYGAAFVDTLPVELR